ncbi:MAG: 2-polyprenyl-6-methoxyphenol hydroxylase and related FAD-dependent oxidoreductases, partial [uncultured Friedmanniella sp.]
ADDVCGGRRRAGRDDAGAAAGPGWRGGGGAGEAPRLPPRLPRRHGARLDHPAARPAGAGGAVPVDAAEPAAELRAASARRHASDHRRLPAAAAALRLRGHGAAVGPARPVGGRRPVRAHLHVADEHRRGRPAVGGRPRRRRPHPDRRRGGGRPARGPGGGLRRPPFGAPRCCGAGPAGVPGSLRHLVVPAAADRERAAGEGFAGADPLRWGDHAQHPAARLLPDRLLQPQGPGRLAAGRGDRAVPRARGPVAARLRRPARRPHLHRRPASPRRPDGPAAAVAPARAAADRGCCPRHVTGRWGGHQPRHPGRGRRGRPARRAAGGGPADRAGPGPGAASPLVADGAAAAGAARPAPADLHPGVGRPDATGVPGSGGGCASGAGPDGGPGPADRLRAPARARPGLRPPGRL